MSKVDVTKMSAEERRALMEELAKQEKESKEQVKADKKAYKELSAQFVEQNIGKCLNVRKLMERVTDELFNDYQSILDLKISAYGDKVKGFASHTSTAPDGSESITVGWNTVITFDGTEEQGIEKIKNVMASLSGDDERVEILSEIINVFLGKNKKTGQLNPAKIIELNTMRDRINSEEFNEGLDIIIAAQIVTRTTMTVSGYKIEDDEGGKPKKVEFRFTI